MKTDGGNFAKTSCNLRNIDTVIMKRNDKRMSNTPSWKFYSCEECSYRTTLSFMIIIHRKRHKVHSNSKMFDCGKSALEKYKCSICSDEYSTSQQALFKRHVRIFHQIQLGRSYENENNQNNNHDKQYTCKNCDFRTYSQLLYIIHYSKCSVKSATNEIERWKCSKCSYNTNSEKLLDDHKRRNHPVYVDYSQEISETESVGNAVQLCDWCDFFTMNRSRLKNHMLDRHNIFENDNVMYTCKECSFKSDLQADLYSHVRNTHIREKFTCEYCPFYSNQKQQLDVHLVIHSHFERGQIEENEEIGQVNFSEKLPISSGSSDLEENLPLSIFSKPQASESDKMYKCEQCSSQYALQTDLMNHILYKHPDRAEQIYLKYFKCRFEASTDEQLNRDVRNNNENAVSKYDKDNNKEKKFSLYSKEKQLEDNVTFNHFSDANTSCNVNILQNILLKKSSSIPDRSKERTLFPRQVNIQKKEFEHVQENEKVVSSSSFGELSTSKYSEFEENIPLSILSQSKEILKSDEMYKCEFCSSQYVLEITLMNHIYHKHPTIAKQIYIKCPKCNFRTTSVKLLKKHIWREHKIGFIECSIDTTSDVEMMEKDSLEKKSPVNTTDKSDESMLRRSNKINDKNIFVQGEEDKGRVSTDALEELSVSSSSSDSEENKPLSVFADSKHLKISKFDKMYKCELCPSQYVLEETLMKHMSYEHLKTAKQIYLQCSKCRFQTTTVQSLEVHWRQEHEHVVIGCGTNSIEEKNNQKSKHNIKQMYTDILKPRVILERLKKQRPITKQVEKSRIKNDQPRVVLERLKIQPPIIIKELEKDRVKDGQRLEQKQATDKEDQKWLTCDLCAFKSLECSKLKWHILSTHVAAETVICFKCQLCSFQTTENRTLQKHVLEVHIDPQCFESVEYE